jgi:hypothetical protein
MEDFKIVVFLMAILISLTAIANKRKLPFPILLVAAGLINGFVRNYPTWPWILMLYLLSSFRPFCMMQLLNLPGMNSGHPSDRFRFRYQ